ncbi:MAG: BREX-2 system phosphatase PglZ [Acidimicrobiales bacterium]
MAAGDRARETVSRGDRHPEARTVLAEIDAQVLDRVRSHGATTARQLANAAYRHDDLLGVEDLLATVAVRAAEAGPVLVLVLDGMGWPSFLEVAEQLERQGWHPVTHADLPAQPTALATLPTVTEFSRASLLCGSLRSGQQDSETRYFPSLEAFRPFDKKPPLLFHKADLRQGGLDTLSGHVVEAIEDRGRHIVGVVLNNIDERLKDVEAPPAGWDLDALTPLRELLRAARHAGRALVVTADRGHILHRDDTQRPGADGGERWRPTESGPAEEGEIEVKGPRVIVESKSCVMPWDERIHYGPKRNGYHGGLTPVELIVPAVVMMTEEAAGWEPLSIPAPSWWYPTLEIPAVESTASAPVPAKRAAKPSDAPTLFDPVPALVPEAADAPGDSVPAEGDWVDRLLVRNDIASQLQGLRLDSAQVSAVLRLLAGAAGTPVQEERLADSLGMPRPRFSRWLGQLQRVLNVDGYEVLASVNGAVRLDRQLLENQMGTL